MKKLDTFEEYQKRIAEEDRSRVEHYAPPKYVIKPAKGDKGFAILKGMFKKLKKVMEPGIWST